jgi:hypothetical protein
MEMKWVFFFVFVRSFTFLMSKMVGFSYVSKKIIYSVVKTSSHIIRCLLKDGVNWYVDIMLTSSYDSAVFSI